MIKEGKGGTKQPQKEDRQLRKRVAKLEKAAAGAREALMESDEKLHRLSDAAFEGLAIHDKGLILESNNAFAALFGYELSEVVGMNALEFAAPGSRDLVRRNIISGSEEPYTAVGLRKDGSTFAGELRGKPIPYKGRRVRVTAIRDITDQQKAYEDLRRSEEKNRALLSAIPDLMFQLDKDGVFLSYKASKKEELYVSPEEFLGKKAGDVLPPDLAGRLMDSMAKALKSDEVQLLEYRLPISGSERDFEARMVAAGGESVLIICRDITARKKAGKALEAEHGRLLSIMDGIDEPIYVADPDTCEVLFINNKLREVFGDAVGRKCHEALQGLKTPCPFCTNDRIFGDNEGKTTIWEFCNRKNNRWYRCLDKAILWPDGRMVRYEMAIDITEQRRAEEEMRILAETAMELVELPPERDIYDFIGEKLRELVGEAVISVNSYDEKTGALEVRKVLGLAGEKLRNLDKLIGTRVSGMKFSRLDSEIKSQLTKGELVKVEGGLYEIFFRRVPKKACRAIEKLFSIKEIYSVGFKRGGRLFGNTTIAVRGGSELNKRLIGAFVSQASIVMQRRFAEEALAAERERLAVTLRSIGDGVIATDTEGRIVLVNKVAEQLTGWSQEEAAGKPLREVFPIINERTRKECENPVDKVVRTGATVGLANHTVLVSRDGTERILKDSGAPIRDRESRIVGVVLVFRDITRERKIEEELTKAEKLESVGVLAGGIAHDFNNILTAILGNIIVARMSGKPGEKAYDLLTEAEKASLRARDLTRQLLTFSKGGAPIRNPASIKQLVEETAGFSLRGSSARGVVKIPDDLWPVDIDEGQISQVINNLVINADQAMPKGGLVRVSAENVQVGSGHALPLARGKYVKLSIKDEGIGISMENLPLIFDPYFTTKQKGSGLGLAVSYSIVRNHDGHITVESSLGKGTTFQVYIPATEKEPPSKKKQAVPAFKEKVRVLLMDDDEMVLRSSTVMLEKLGCRVTAARDGAGVLAQYRKAKKSGRPFDVVIMDLTVAGGEGGREAIGKLLKIDPGARAIVSSGYSTDPILANFRQYGFCGCLAKPYGLAEMRSKISGVLSGEKSG
ncbi:MAG: PAS domain S-box protein [Pseudomonadota bacterium]